MGIDISAKLIYGLHYSDIPEDILEEVDEMIDNGELDYASPYYDAPRDEYRDWETDRKSTRLNSSHRSLSRMPSSA